MDPVATESFEPLAWSELLGFEMPHSAPGEVTLRIDPKPEFHNQNGTVAAPISFALAEAAGAAVIVMGFLDLLADTYTVVREARLEFVAAARGPLSATARLDPARIEEIRSIVVAGGQVDEPIELEVVDESGRVVARVAQTLTVRPIRSP